MAVLTTSSGDGIDVQALDDGTGPVILVLHAAREGVSAWRRVAADLSNRFRVVRVRRRQHRPELRPVLPCTIEQEVQDVLAVIEMVGGPVLVVGHSSGGVVALEAMVTSPAAFSGAVLYEPPLVVGQPLGGEALSAAMAAHAAGRAGDALTIFLRDVVGVRPPLARLVGGITGVVPHRRASVSHQLDDCQAVDNLGVRLDAYSRIDAPVMLLGGSRSPAHFGERMAALAGVLKSVDTVVLRRHGHYANILAPRRMAELIAAHAERAFGMGETRPGR